MNVKNHYEHHLANFYTWMVGDVEKKQTEFQSFLKSNKINPNSTKVAIDLGAGNGIQSIALNSLGFKVTSVDFNKKLLNELQSNQKASSITTIYKDIRQVKEFKELKPELIVCCGDTITHLEDLTEVTALIKDCSNILNEKGKLILSFRDYSKKLNEEERFIPVKNDENRILTCVLDYEPKHIKVTDLLYEKTADGWMQKVSSYKKVIITREEIEKLISSNELTIILNKSINGMLTLIAEKSVI